MAHWSDKYIGEPYIEGENDCAALVQRVLYVEFGVLVDMPGERAAGLRGLTRQIEDNKLRVAEPVESPREGDGVLMMGRGSLDHVGVYCEIAGEGWVLHAMRNARQVCRHRLRDLANLGLDVEGFYRWK
ncbi:MAG TPA: peptidoglycan endopeptidase [Chromatiales bacterium]|nr:peptidoglycan endopeptidase [Chromatiales bacterium]